MVEGDRVYSKLKYESGVHRVQRVPATEASGRIHTSAVTVAVLPEARDRAQDYPGVYLADSFIVHPQALQHPRSELLDHNIGILDHLNLFSQIIDVDCISNRLII
jgi:hypothetical protein